MSNNPLSNLSYTNKDFNSIYTELLDLVKQLTYKWDPSISNESDPGNILLKLNAIIGDKNNYNTDKNILENFPETLTQDISARSLYKQLAYHMPWYKAATTDVTFKWVGKDSTELTDISDSVIIPKFKMISDANTEFVYTTLSDMVFNKWSSTQTVKAIEGIITTLSINGQEIIELSNLDYHNRIYFNENNIAENGIFIYNHGGSENDYWTMVDNLQVESLGKKYFEFGIDSRKNLCYVEFPDDIHNLIGNGLVIKYIVTNGEDGNIIARTLDRFYGESTVKVNGEDVVLNADIIQLSNPSGTNNGTNPEDIDTAYKHYRRTAGTFHTLVTLRDYMNAIYNSGLVSNAKVCDRLNDIQSTYTIVTDNEFTNGIVKQVATTNKSDFVGLIKIGSAQEMQPAWTENKFYKYVKAQNSETFNMVLITDEAEFVADWKNCFYIADEVKQDLGAFDLKLYLLHTPGVVSTFEDYVSTFKLEPTQRVGKQEPVVFNNVLGYIRDENCVQHDYKGLLPGLPCLFKNSFPLNIKIIPHYKLGDEQIKELKININKALFKLLNSSKLEFGIEANYDKIYDAICKADERIKVLILDDFVYTTFATYWDGEQFKDIPISEFNSNYIIEVNSKDEVSVYKLLLSDYLYKNTYFVEKGSNIIYKVINDIVTEYSDKLNDFRRDIITKSILAGRTPLYNQDTRFRYSLDQESLQLVDTDRISTSLKICPHGMDESGKPVEITKENKTSMRTAEYELKANENIRLLAPSFITETTYSNYVKFELILNESSNYQEQQVQLSYVDYRSDTSKNYGPIIIEEQGGDGESIVEQKCIITYEDFCDKEKQEARNLLNREVRIYNDHTDVLVYEGKLSKIIADDPTFELDWSTYTYRVESDLFIYDLTEEQMKDWENKQLDVIYTAIIHNVPANADYELQEGEYITFFYKTEDIDEAPYTYKKYSKGTIIKPSFIMQGILKNDALVNVDKLASEGTIPYSELSISMYQQIYGMYNYNDLSGSKTVAIRKMNEKDLNKDEHYYYFITNNLVYNEEGKANYVLQPIVSDDNKVSKYILNNDEYFIYTNADRTEFEMLGAGTLLLFYTKDKDDISKQYALPEDTQLQVPVVDYEVIATQGLSSFTDSCKKMSSFYMTAREQQIYNFSEKDKLIITLTEEQLKKFDEVENYSFTAPYFETGRDTIIEGYDVSYISQGSVQNLPKITVQKDEAKWVGTAILNISSSYDEAQKIHQNDKFSQKSVTVAKESHSPIDSDIYLLSSVMLDKVGGSNIDITYVDSYGKRSNPYIFLYILNKDYNGQYIIKNSDGSICLTLANVEDATSITLAKYEVIDEYQIMLPVRNVCENLTFRLKIDGVHATPINVRKSESNLALGRGIYYFVLDNKECELEVEWYETTSNISDQIIFEPLFKFTYNDLFEKQYGISYDKIYERIKDYDIDNVFDYTHTVENDLYVKDPLKAKSFFDSAHIFNEFTLPMADLYMSDKTQSNITLINNR